MSAPAISVLLPVRDAETTLAACLASLARQSERDFECVIADDGSADASLAIARACAARDARFRVLALRRRGLVAALEAGLAECRGPRVARMDADDLAPRQRLAVQRAALEADPRLAAVGSRVRCFPRKTLGAGSRAYERWLNAIETPEDVAREAFIECPIAHPSLFARADALRRFGYRDVDWPEDYDLVLRMLGAGLRLGVVPRRLLAWRHSAERHSRRDPRYADRRFSACKAEFLAKGFLQGSREYLLWGFGRTGRALARELRARDRHPAAIVELDPRKLGQSIHGARVIPPDALQGPGEIPLLASVAGLPARSRIRAHLAARGWREGTHFLCAA
jgi:glycosyltransferase involved in cell wall biosynthesis